MENEDIRKDNSDSEDSDGGSLDDVSKFRGLFALWALTWGIQQNAVDALLAIFRLFHWGIGLPKTCRTLLKTPRKVEEIKLVSPGSYYHFGILNGLLTIIRSMQNIPTTIGILINIDGIPISKSSSEQF